uniref:Uncharacterized protein n=1 Tax=Rhizophora mucronata TaxID=61149 RepID=A0A2P2NB42_RHIMU
MSISSVSSFKTSLDHSVVLCCEDLFNP